MKKDLVEALLEQLCLALPYVEEAQDDPVNKREKVAARVAKIRAVIARAESELNPDGSLNSVQQTTGGNMAEAKKKLTCVELGDIMLKEAGAEACQAGYGTTDPEWVGRYALQYCDIRPDGTLN